MSHSIHIQNKTYTFSSLKEKEIINEKDLSEYTKSTLLFCSDWLRGKSTFTLNTSGSTGKPKPIEIQRQQMEVSASLTAKALGLQNGHHAFCCLNTAFIAGVMMLVRAMEVGMDITVIEPCSRPFKDFQNSSFDFTALVPLQVQESLKYKEDEQVLAKTQNIIIGGAPVSFGLELDIIKMLSDVNVYATYGMTETVSHIALRRIALSDKQGIYKVLEGVKIKTDKRGCLSIEAPMSKEDILYTNDLVSIVSENEFIWQGRIDNTVNSGGIKIQAEKVERAIENVFSEWTISNRFFVAGLPDDKLGEKLCLFIEGKFDFSFQDLVTHLQSTLSKYEIPKEICELERFVQTPTEKVKRKECIQTYLERNKPE